jgi:hypothetical protein
MMRALLVAAMLAAALSAHAEEARRAIVVPTQLGGFIPNRTEMRAALDVMVANRLRRARVTVQAPTLSAAEGQCFDGPCLAALAERHRVDVVVASRLIDDEQRAANAYHVAVRVWVRGETPALRTRDQACPLCSEDKATELLATLVAQAYANEAPPADAPAADAAASAVAPMAATATAAAGAPASSAISALAADFAAPPAPSPSTSKRLWILRGGAIGLGAGWLVALALGSWKAAQDGEVRCDPDCRRRDTSAGQAAAFTVSGVALSGAVTLAVLGLRRAADR